MIGDHILISGRNLPGKQPFPKPFLRKRQTTILLSKESYKTNRRMNDRGGHYRSPCYFNRQHHQCKRGVPAHAARLASPVYALLLPLSYEPRKIEASLLAGQHTVITLDAKIIPIQEVVVRIVNPLRLLRDMKENIRKNYPQSPAYLTTFYREGIERKINS
mgnify:CR=1 FL=1